jgi:hypothetical protein
MPVPYNVTFKQVRPAGRTNKKGQTRMGLPFGI